MRISKFSDYTLRVLIFLASCERPATARKIADAYRISFHHVAKTAQFLAREGYVVASRGRAGGMCLARPVDKISIGVVIRKSEKGSAELVECMRPGGGRCAIAPVCKLANALQSAQEAFFACLDDTTLEDITSNKALLKNLLTAA